MSVKVLFYTVVRITQTDRLLDRGALSATATFIPPATLGTRLITQTTKCVDDVVCMHQSSEKRQNTLLHAVLTRNTLGKTGITTRGFVSDS